METPSSKQAQHIVELLAQGQFDQVEQRLADSIKPFLTVGTIQATWQGIEQQFGAFQELVKTSAVQTQQGLVHVVTCVFERARLDVNIVFNDAGEIIGLTVKPEGTVEQQANATHQPPPPALPDLLQEPERQIATGKSFSPGTLNIPQSSP